MKLRQLGKALLGRAKGRIDQLTFFCHTLPQAQGLLFPDSKASSWADSFPFVNKWCQSPAMQEQAGIWELPSQGDMQLY